MPGLARTPDEQRWRIGERTLLARRRLGLNQRRLATQIGWGVNRVSDVERATTDLDVTEIYDLADALRCSVEYLLGVSDELGEPPSPRRSQKRCYGDGSHALDVAIA